ncbi:hypothetical protein PybrP1_003604, partial [[Pythium] brassicae (nom. inval.)]
ASERRFPGPASGTWRKLWQSTGQGSAHEAELLAVLMLKLTLGSPRSSARPLTPWAGPSYERVLFFNGASRGLRSRRVRAVIAPALAAPLGRAVSMSPAHLAVTNNTGEYDGLIYGLRIAHLHQRLPLYVIGDSALILLRSFFHCISEPACCGLGRGALLGGHHYQRHNKIADALANVAMGSKASAQDWWPSPNTQMGGAADWLSNDENCWVDTRSAEEIKDPP